jgi:hypothetical protein
VSPVPLLPTPIVPSSDSITTADGTSCSILALLVLVSLIPLSFLRFPKL